MEEDDRHERLRKLEARLARRQAKEELPTGAEKYTQANVAWRMVTELVAGLLIGLGVGLGLDSLFGTKPFLLILFIFLGFIAGVKTMLRTATEVQEKQAAAAAGDTRATEIAGTTPAAGAVETTQAAGAAGIERAAEAAEDKQAAEAARDRQADGSAGDERD